MYIGLIKCVDSSVGSNHTKAINPGLHETRNAQQEVPNVPSLHPSPPQLSIVNIWTRVAYLRVAVIMCSLLSPSTYIHT